MTALVDANVFIRHFTGEPPEMAERATAYLAAADLLVLSDLILAEIVYVLESFYKTPRGSVAQAAHAVVASKNVKTADPDLLLRAIEVYERPRRPRHRQSPSEPCSHTQDHTPQAPPRTASTHYP